MTDAIKEGTNILTLEQEINLEKNLVWIFGSPRSGTTWLMRLFPKNITNYFAEPLIGEHLASLRGDVLTNVENNKSQNTSHPSSKISKNYYLILLKKLIRIRKNPIRELGNTFIRRIDEQKERESYFFSEKYKDVWQLFIRKLILNRIYSQFQDIESKVIIKEPNGSMASDIISECLPNSKIIVILRDGRDVVNSHITAMSEGGYVVKQRKGFEPLSGPTRTMSIIRQAQKWVILMKIVMKAYENHDKDSKILVRYEELRNNTLAELKKIYSFVGLDDAKNETKLKKIVSRRAFENIPSDSKGIGTTRQFATVGKWKQSFTEKEKKLIHDIMGPTLKELGYI